MLRKFLYWQFRLCSLKFFSVKQFLCKLSFWLRTGCSATLSLVGGSVQTNVTGDLVTHSFKCNQGYTMVGKNSISCRGGSWYGSKPTCYKGQWNCSSTLIWKNVCKLSLLVLLLALLENLSWRLWIQRGSRDFVIYSFWDKQTKIRWKRLRKSASLTVNSLTAKLTTQLKEPESDSQAFHSGNDCCSGCHN